MRGDEDQGAEAGAMDEEAFEDPSGDGEGLNLGLCGIKGERVREGKHPPP